ncbi:alcohol dehydrogenase catalytic domain-containing protein [Amycolatopsis sacchari]|uniref:alcohol dehydrogenase catalytic domain-containing protein n=1 Tax=Amycolatopsis sacchari TaxID=115433 RepID=UPI003EBC964D
MVDKPVREPAGEVRIRIEAFDVNRLDELTRSGSSPRPVRLPHARLGCEGTGTIDTPGPGVDEFAIGDAVAYSTAYGRGAVPRRDAGRDVRRLPASGRPAGGLRLDRLGSGAASPATSANTAAGERHG